MTKVIACHDVVHGCTYKAEAASEEELIAKVAAHAREAHGVIEVSPDLLAKVKGAIHDARKSA